MLSYYAHFERLFTCKPFDAHCCHMGTARPIKHPVPGVPDRVKPQFLTSGHSDAQS